MIDEIMKQITTILNVENESVKNLRRFPGGMSNYTYHFEVDKDKYVIRVPGDGAEKYVDYHNELNAIIGALDYKITASLIYFDVESGVKLSKYIIGECWNFFDNSSKIEDLIYGLKKLHSIKTPNVNNYQLIDRLNKYESYNKIIPDQIYFEIKSWWIDKYKTSYQQNPVVFCHNDLQTANIINQDNQVYFIDFEYAGYNDVYYDLASFEEHAIYVFEHYFERKITNEDLFHLKFYQIYQSLQWYQVATYKESIGFSKNTNFNFKELADYFISHASNLYLQLRKDDLNEVK